MLPEPTQSTIRLSARLLSERFWFRHVLKVAYQVCDIYMDDMQIGWVSVGCRWCFDDSADAIIIRHSRQLDALLLVLDFIRRPFGLDW